MDNATTQLSYSTIVLYSGDDEGVGVVHEEKSTQKILHSHFTVLVRYKQAQMCLQNDPKRLQRGATKFKKNIILANFLLPHCLTDASVAESWLQLQPCFFGGNTSNFVEKKPFTILNTYDVCATVLLFYL